ncbi:hypothetical protein NE857_06725 [Nocardiopsis exhalans]|uniref:Uncharacterized protein n=1 Tax=Nocardiopsis exhalans TaxID=163604 RepID=A0ABY5DDK5_9ACTN|nr:hypothetical protein [Nocardiopsis exhalans]USY21308.1 hypothetical protein NE857_06725 [Nocardiopsis exhalans]
MNTNASSPSARSHPHARSHTPALKPLPSGVAPGSLAPRPLGSSPLNPVPVAPGGASRADELVSEIGRLLRRPGRSAHAVRTLTRVDGLFSELDRQIRSGGPLPSIWRAALRPAPPSSRRGIAYEYATQCYDAVSETLWEVGGVVVAWRALREAAREWERLNRALIERSPLPEPWLPPDGRPEQLPRPTGSRG